MSETLTRRLTPTNVGISLLSASVLVLFGVVLSDPASIAGRMGAGAPSLAVVARNANPVFHPEAFAPEDSLMALTTLALRSELDSLDYTLAAVRSGKGAVPRVYVPSLPDDMGTVDVPAERKRLFIKTTLPLILAVNEDILQDRARLKRVIADVEAGRTLAAKDQVWLDEIVRQYEVEPGDFDALLKRLDMVPPSLALAQAAVESGWGTSRFAQEGNALYGERIFAEGFGLVPGARGAGESHEIRVFPRLIDSVASYVLNLNTHAAYATFRDKRASLRASGQELAGLALVDWLVPYSEERKGYITTVKRVIKGNQLWQFDEARLNSSVQVAELGTIAR